MQKQHRAKRLLSMAEEAREQARAELAQTNQRLHAAETERQLAEKQLLEDHRSTGRSADWILVELDQEHRRRELKQALEAEKKTQQEVVVAEQKAAAAHQKHRVFERFHDNIAHRIESKERRKESTEADSFALVMWSKKKAATDE
jgi:rubrerythrin